MVLGGTIYSAMDGPGGPILGGTTYGMTGKVQSFVRPINFFGKNCTAHYIMKSSIADILGFGLHSLHHTAIIQSVMCEGSEHTHLHAVKDTIQFLWRVPLDMMLHTIWQT